MTEQGRLSTDDLARAGRERKAPPEGLANRETGAAVVDAPQPPGVEEAHAPLFPGNDADRFRKRWADIQASFVDEPRSAVKEADGLVAETMKCIAETFANERTTLEHQWDRGDNVTTEDLRVALQRYRSFFSRLLSI